MKKRKENFEKRPGLKWLLDNVCHKGGECLTWPFSRNRGGYGQLAAFGKFQLAHRYMCFLAHGFPRTSEHHAAHSCGNGHLGCVNPKHLSWKTASQNHTESRPHPRWKLTPDQVAEIRKLKGVESNQVTAARYGVIEPTIRKIRAGKTWRTSQHSAAPSPQTAVR